MPPLSDLLGAAASHFGGYEKPVRFLKFWIYEDRVAVVNFRIRDCEFAFDIMAADDEKTSLRVELLARNQVESGDIHALGFEKISANRVLVGIVPRRDLDEWQIADLLELLSSTLGVMSRDLSLKVAVLTLPLNNNIGGNLQGYALMEVLRQLGHSPVLLSRRQPPAGVDTVPADDPKLPLITNSYGMSQPNRRFVETHMTPISRSFSWSPHLRKAIGEYEFDAIVVGSDQVWRPKITKSIYADYFLDFLPAQRNPSRRISYAASFGVPHWEFDAGQAREAARLISHFDAVSVREDSGVALARAHLGVEARHVLDPTMLLPPEHYSTTFALAGIHQGEDRLLSYILDLTSDKARVVEDIAARLGLNAFTTNGLPFSYPLPASPAGGDKSVEGWLASLYNAAFVMTDSFHGTVFSILFNKPFIAYGNPGRGIARFTSLLKMVGLEDRIVLKSTDIDLDRLLEPIDWQAVNQRVKTLRAESIGFLQTSLTGYPPRPTATAGRAADPATPPVATSAVTRAAPLALSATPAEVSAHPLNVLCSGCGVCVSESDGALAMAWDGDGFLVPQAQASDIPLKALRVCPFNPDPAPEVADEDALAKIFLSAAPKTDARLGRFENTYVGYSKAFRPTSSSGGIATYVFGKLLDQDHIDRLYIVKGDRGSGYRYQLFRRGEDIHTISKTRYVPVTLEDFFSAIDGSGDRVAVSGVPCFLKAIRLKQHYHPRLKDRIPFLMGIICGGLKSRGYTDFLAQSAGIFGPYQSAEYRLKDPDSSASDYAFSAQDSEGRSHEVKMSRLGDMWGTGLFKARACDFCTDVVAELADISLGDAWLPEYRQDGMGNSVIITRSALADKIIREGISAGELSVVPISPEKIVQSQSGGFAHRQDGIGFRAWVAKNQLDLPLPAIRPRLLRRGALPDALVQILRDRTRARSLRLWKSTGHAPTVRKRLRGALQTLKSATGARRSKDATFNDVLARLSAGQSAELWELSAGLPREQRVALRWILTRQKGALPRFDTLQQAFQDGVIAPSPPRALAPSSGETKGTPIAAPPSKAPPSPQRPPVTVARATLAEFPDVPLWRVSAFEVYEKLGGVFVSPHGNRITITGVNDPESLRKTSIYFSGQENEVVLDGLRQVSRLDIACIEGSTVRIGRPQSVRGATIMASRKSTITIGSDCLISRDVIFYCSGAHTFYGPDGKPKGDRQLTVGDHVWISQGARLLAGADVGRNAVVGSYSVLAGTVPESCEAAGNPCKVMSRNISWKA